MFWETLSSIVSLWMISDSYTHAFLIFPISLFLIWEKRYEIFKLEKKSNLYFVFLSLLLVFGWILADLVNINVVRHFMVILLIPVVITALYGTALLKLLLFPLLYLLFAVPFGDFLIPKLQDVTAYITVLGIELTGIPVYWEGLFITIPSGDFEVAVACSGIRYLIASLALGTLFAYITYQKPHKRIIFILLAIIVPIIANGIRAYGIVMIAHLSNMEYATGFDHLIYGWVFFGFVIFILFYIGNKWADELPAVQKPDETSLHSDFFKPKFSILLSLFLVMSLSPISAYWYSQQKVHANKTIQLNHLFKKTNIIEKETDHRWKPIFANTDLEVFHTIKQNNHLIDLYVAYYASQQDGKKLVTSSHQLYDMDKFKLIDKQLFTTKVKDKNILIDEQILTTGIQKRLVWNWYYVDGKILINRIEIKLLQAFNVLLGKTQAGSFIAISTEYDNVQDARQKLTQFISNHWNGIRGEIDK